MGYRPRLSRCAHCRTPLDVSEGGRMGYCRGRTVLPGLCLPRHVSCYARSDRLDESDPPPGLVPQKNTGAGMLFDMLRRYVESRLETPIKAGRLLP